MDIFVYSIMVCIMDFENSNTPVLTYTENKDNLVSAIDQSHMCIASKQHDTCTKEQYTLKPFTTLGSKIKSKSQFIIG